MTKRKKPFPPEPYQRQGYKIVEVKHGDGSTHYELRDGVFVLSMDWGGPVKFRTIRAAERERKRQERLRARERIVSERVVS